MSFYGRIYNRAHPRERSGPNLRGARSNTAVVRNSHDSGSTRFTEESDMPQRRPDNYRGRAMRGRGAPPFRGGRGRGRGREFWEREFRMGVRDLQRLENLDTSETLATIANPQSGFRLLLQSEGELRGDIICGILAVLVKACSYKGAPQMLIQILTEVSNSPFLKFQINKHYTNLLFSRINEHEVNQATNDATTLFLTMLQVLPSSCGEIFVVYLTIDSVLKQLTAGRICAASDVVLRKMQEVGTTCSEKMQQRTEKIKRRQIRIHPNEIAPPPNDFREISVIPNADDVKSDITPYLRVNRMKGAYDDLDHYLDVQFRLLREDFVRPMREGITTYLRMNGRVDRSLNDIRIYNNVQIMYPVCNLSGVSHRIKFDVRSFHKMRWENSKRLIFGSLVCLSRDQFNTLYFAVVANRDPKDLEKGELEVQFDHNLEDIEAIPVEATFVMAETTAYFEAYRHVLRGMQTVTEDFPFQTYLIDGDVNVISPKYVTKKKWEPFDMTCICEESQSGSEVKHFINHSQLRGVHSLEGRLETLRLQRSYRVKKKSEILLLDERTWPSAEKLKLDDSQFEALQAALIRELAIIQGPPGTGKTYIGLKIAKCLLNNTKFWHQGSSPMLVVCYTNHALDQFLEGIHDFCKKGIVRVGGRCKSEVLQKMNLKELRREAREKRDVPLAIYAGRRDTRALMGNLDARMDEATAKIAATVKGVVRENILHPFMTQNHIQEIKSMTAEYDVYGHGVKRQSALAEWLGLSNSRDEIPQFYEEEIDEDGHQLQIDEEEEQEPIQAQEEAEIEQMRRFIEVEDDFDKQRQQMHRRNLLQAENDIAFNIEDIEDTSPGYGEWQTVQGNRRQRKQKLIRLLQNTDAMTEAQALRVRKLMNLDATDRWRLYRYWVGRHRANLRQSIRTCVQQYQDAAVRLREVMNQEDEFVMKGAKVLGMTTTGAAKYRNILQEIKPKIIIVEEAAEVLEAHIVTTLSPGCEHLILIGDHKQLRPNPTVYELAEKFNLKISLFERLVNNGIPCVTLQNQHRMRPEISQFMQHIYRGLHDDNSVKHFDPIIGVNKNVFFLTHNIREEHDDELKSKSNNHEAMFTAALCKYLILQGYQQSQITILTPYTGQVLKLKKHMPKKTFDGVRITAIDNFQGEENDIILISLVRSNKDNKVGFLKEENRVCVTLSRAKKGMYVIGNFSMLEQNSLWYNVIKTAKQQEMYGTELQLYCQNHPNDHGAAVSTANDFKNVPEGGCMKPCEYRLPCGHACTMPCHTYDLDHKEYKCRKRCPRILCDLDHVCPELCYVKCKPCRKLVQKNLICGHPNQVLCYKDPSTVPCSFNCDEVLECGHRCQNKCGEKHTDVCKTPMRKKLLCGHNVTMKCSDDPIRYKCDSACSAVLDCGHKCKGTCSSCHAGRIHQPCTSKCGRILVCGHECKVNCTRECPPCTEPCKNRCKHSRCHRKCGDPCVKCTEPCEWQCRHTKCAKLCFESCNRRKCTGRCLEMLKCKHECIGMCGEPCPNKCRVCDKKEVQTILFGNEDEDDARFVQLEDCGHIIEVASLDQWMNTIDTSMSVQLKGCPKCKTPIRRNLRYGKEIKEMLNNIEEVKAKIAGNRIEIERKVQLLEVENRKLSRLDREVYEVLKERLQNEAFSISKINTLENSINFMHCLCTLKKALKERQIFKESANDHIDEICNWILKKQLYSDQELKEAKLEIDRLQMFVNFSIIMKRISDQHVQFTAKGNDMISKAHNSFISKQVLDEKERKTLLEVITVLDKEVPSTGLGITKQERVEIVKAMGLTQGHWFKCPKGHLYAIGECGGATELSRCPECKAVIGGTGHRLATGNQHTGEMDGSPFAAWSEQANLQNYGFEDRF